MVATCCHNVRCYGCILKLIIDVSKKLFGLEFKDDQIDCREEPGDIMLESLKPISDEHLLLQNKASYVWDKILGRACVRVVLVFLN